MHPVQDPAEFSPGPAGPQGGHAHQEEGQPAQEHVRPDAVLDAVLDRRSDRVVLRVRKASSTSWSCL